MGQRLWESRRLSKIYRDMIRRCYNPDDKSYRWYGGKGIHVCDEWLNDPGEFQRWAFENGYDDDLTIDRRKSNEDYCPENCHWISGKNNTKFKSTTTMISVNDIPHTGREWADVLGIATNTINRMLRVYPTKAVVEFIRRRLADPARQCGQGQSWLETYQIDT